MILRGRRSTSYDPVSLFRGRRSSYSSLERRSRKIAKPIGTRPSALHSTFKNLAELLRFWWGSLAELLRFWRCQVPKLRKSRCIAAFLTLSSSKTEEVSQNSCIFKLAGRQIDGWTATTATTRLHSTTTTTSTNILRYITQPQLHYTMLITSNSI